MLKLPQEVIYILTELSKNDYKAYVVGGCIRDMLSGNQPHDYDIATSATPTEVRKVFEGFSIVDSGEKYGTVSLKLSSNGIVYEITTFRREGRYVDSRHPNDVNFTTDLYTDLLRRDFTINAMAYNPDEGLLDYFGGERDIFTNTLKCVGIARNRFDEDALRIMRALRFISMGFIPTDELDKAINDLQHTLTLVASERLAKEIMSIAKYKRASYVVSKYSNVFFTIFPSLLPLYNFDQKSKWHNLDAWEHTLKVIDGVCKESSNTEGRQILFLSALFHDVGKPDTFTTDDEGYRHFKGHPERSTVIVDEELKKYAFPKRIRDSVLLLVKNHDRELTYSDRTVKRLVQALGSKKLAYLWLHLKKADIQAHTDESITVLLPKFEAFSKLLKDYLTSPPVFSIADLNINGFELMKMGITDGKDIGKVKKLLFQDVLDDKLKNEHNALVLEAQRLRDSIL